MQAPPSTPESSSSMTLLFLFTILLGGLMLFAIHASGYHDLFLGASKLEAKPQGQTWPSSGKPSGEKSAAPLASAQATSRTMMEGSYVHVDAADADFEMVGRS